MVHTETVSKQTIVFVTDRTNGRVLLPKKGNVTKFGGGKFNGYGGKCENNESVEEAAIRELREESNLVAKETDLNFVAIIRSAKDDVKTKRIVYIYTVDYENTSKNYGKTEEMIDPTWFSFVRLPFDSMWPDCPLWMPKIFEGKFVDAEFLYDFDGKLCKEIVTCLKLPICDKENLKNNS